MAIQRRKNLKDLSKAIPDEGMDGSWKWRLVNVLDYVEESKCFWLPGHTMEKSMFHDSTEIRR